MVKFKTMWNDVNKIIKDNNLKFEDMIIQRSYPGGFIVNVEGQNNFLNKCDFVDFWCKMLYFNEISEDELLKNKENKQQWVYKIIKTLPYIKKEEKGTLRLVE